MNCNNCGAPMTLVEGRDYFCCEFCSTLAFPSGPDDSPDRVTLLESSADEDCPVCETTLQHAALDGGRILHCQTCRGILCETETFAHVVKSRRATFDGVDVTPQPLDPKQYARRLGCPVCGRNMEVHPYYGPGNVVIDSCARCKLIWVDPGEMAAIERAPGVR